MSLHAVFAGIRPAQLDMNRFWRESVLCALASHAIAQRTGAVAAERSFVMGLLADIATSCCSRPRRNWPRRPARLPGKAEKPCTSSKGGSSAATSAEVGATLMDQWRVPRAFAEAIGAQTLPRLGGEHAADAAALNLASHIVAADRIGESSEQVGARIDQTVWDLLELDAECIAAVREEAELNLAAYLSLFFPSAPAGSPEPLNPREHWVFVQETGRLLLLHLVLFFKCNTKETIKRLFLKHFIFLR